MSEPSAATETKPEKATIVWYRPLGSPPLPQPPVFLDGEAQKLFSIGDAIGGEAGAFITSMARRLEWQCEQLTTLQSLTGYNYADGVKEGERRVMRRANVEPPAPSRSLKDLLKTKELQALIAAAPIKRVEKGVSGIDPLTNKPKAPKANAKLAVELSDDDFKELDL